MFVLPPTSISKPFESHNRYDTCMILFRSNSRHSCETFPIPNPFKTISLINSTIDNTLNPTSRPFGIRQEMPRKRESTRKRYEYVEPSPKGGQGFVRELVEILTSPRKSKQSPSRRESRNEDPPRRSTDPRPSPRHEKSTRSLQTDPGPRRRTSNRDDGRQWRSTSPTRNRRQPATPTRSPYERTFVNEDNYRSRIIESDDDYDAINPTDSTWSSPNPRQNHRSYEDQARSVLGAPTARPKSERVEASNSRQGEAPAVMSAGKLQAELDIEPESMQNHLQAASEGLDEVAPIDRAIAKAILSLPSLHYWIKTRDSGILVVHGNCNDEGFEGNFSPVSDPVSLLYRYERKNGDTRPIAFFCGATHYDYYDTAYDMAIKMLRSILFQFVDCQDRLEYDIEALGDIQIKHLSASGLCKFLSDVMMDAMDGKTPVCLTIMIDGAQFLEIKDNIEDFRGALRMFRNLVGYARRSKNGSNVKVMMFFPRTSKTAHKAASNDGVLDLTINDLDKLGQGAPVNSVDNLTNLWYSLKRDRR